MFFIQKNEMLRLWQSKDFSERQLQMRAKITGFMHRISEPGDTWSTINLVVLADTKNINLFERVALYNLKLTLLKTYTT